MSEYEMFQQLVHQQEQRLQVDSATWERLADDLHQLAGNLQHRAAH